MTLKSIIEKTIFCFDATASKREGCKLFAWTFLLVFYSRFFQKTLKQSKKIKKIRIKTNKGSFDIKMRLQDISVFYEIFYSKTYSFEKPPIGSGVVLDLGAHIGLASLFFWTNNLTPIKYYCVEPSGENLKLLEYNTRLFDCTIINKAISNFNGFGFLKTDAFGHNYVLSEKGNKLVKVEVCTIDSIVNSFKIEEIALCKMDIEGTEEIVLFEAGTWVEKTKLLILETHTESIKTKISALGRSFPWQLSLSPVKTNPNLLVLVKRTGNVALA